jgi:hypothetical protein
VTATGRDLPDAVSRDEFNDQMRWTSWLRFMSVAISHALVLKASISSFSSKYPDFPGGLPLYSALWRNKVVSADVKLTHPPK